MKSTLVGPFNNPFKATVKALDAAEMDTTEFTTFRLWDAVGEYPFFESPEDFVEDLCAWIAVTVNVVVQLRPDGFWAEYDKDAK